LRKQKTKTEAGERESGQAANSGNACANESEREKSTREEKSSTRIQQQVPWAWGFVFVE